MRSTKHHCTFNAFRHTQNIIFAEFFKRNSPFSQPSFLVPRIKTWLLCFSFFSRTLENPGCEWDCIKTKSSQLYMQKDLPASSWDLHFPGENPCFFLIPLQKCSTWDPQTQLFTWKEVLSCKKRTMKASLVELMENVCSESCGDAHGLSMIYGPPSTCGKLMPLPKLCSCKTIGEWSPRLLAENSAFH